MKEFKCYITLENDAFQENCSAELARILVKLANIISEDYTQCDNVNPEFFRSIMDINGNKVGSFTIKEEK